MAAGAKRSGSSGKKSVSLIDVTNICVVVVPASTVAGGNEDAESVANCLWK